MVCPEENAIFHCAGDTTLIEYRVTSTCGSLDYETSFSSSSSDGHTRLPFYASLLLCLQIPHSPVTPSL